MNVISYKLKRFSALWYIDLAFAIFARSSFREVGKRVHGGTIAPMIFQREGNVCKSAPVQAPHYYCAD